MASKKGIAVTAGILGAITAASFIVWFLPAGTPSGSSSEDFESRFESIKKRHELLSQRANKDFENLLQGDTDPNAYIKAAKETQSRANSLSIELIQSYSPEKWDKKYLEYEESLKYFNDYITETITIANKISSGSDKSALKEEIEKANELYQKSESLAKQFR